MQYMQPLDDMPKEIFTVKYDGQALQDHEMDVAILAPALMAMGKLTQEISKIVSNGDYTATLSVRGNINAGSVEIELVTQATLIQQIVGFFTTPAVTAVANIGGVVGLIASVIKLVIKHRGNMPTSNKDVGNDTIEMNFNGQIEIVNLYVYHTYINHGLRHQIYETLKPLEQQGIDSFTIKNETGELAHVADDEIGYFNPNSIIRPLNESITTVTLIIESITFKEKNKWTFHDGSNSIKAVIADDAFLTKIDNGKRFAKGDWLTVELKTTQTEEGGKLKRQYEIIKVLEHIVRGEQYKLDI